MCVTEYRHLYLAFGRKKKKKKNDGWALSSAVHGSGEGEPCDIPEATQSQHEEVPQMWKCCWPRPFFFLCHQGHGACNAPRRIQLCRVKGAESRAPAGHRPPRTPAFMRVNRRVSTMTKTCIIRLPHTCLQNNVICPHTDSPSQRIH